MEYHPLKGIPREREKNLRRPVSTSERYQRTRMKLHALIASAADDATQRHWLKVELALMLAEATGRRIGLIRQLRWEDVDVTSHLMTWCADADKQGQEWQVPIPESFDRVSIWSIPVVPL